MRTLALLLTPPSAVLLRWLLRRVQVAIVRVDYPQRWPDVFQALLATLPNGPVSIDLFLRVLKALHDEVVVNEEGNGYDAEVAARVKDAMRERCLPQVRGHVSKRDPEPWLLRRRQRRWRGGLLLRRRRRRRRQR